MVEKEIDARVLYRRRLNEFNSRLYTISHDPEVKEVYRQWVEEIRRYINGESNN